MKLHADTHRPLLAVTAYGAGYVTVAGRKLHRSLLLLPDRIDESWGPPGFALLDIAHLAPLALLDCDVLLLGTGMQLRFPPAALLRPFYEAGRAIEVMDTAAACRTYNILAAEGRTVAAALIVETGT
ncbi:MAG: Mth938-like domain-containing protein [Pseudomonadota bacterium]